MSSIEWVFRPELDHPVMLCAFSGWNDGGEAATTAVRHLSEQWGARRFAGLDPEDFYDFQVHRPTVRLLDGQTRRIDWPENDFFVARSGERDVILFLGVEPNTRWRAFCGSVLQVASELGVEVLVTMGAFLADVPHTMSPPVNAASADADWLAKPGVVPARYEGPTGIVGVVNDSAAKVGLSAVSLWGAAPHYLPSGTNPAVALALLEHLRDLFDLRIDLESMAGLARTWRHEVDEAIAEDGNLGDYVRRLEEAASARDVDEMPSGEDIAEELERFLRDQRDDD